MADSSPDLDRATPWEALFRLGRVGDLPDARLLDLFVAGRGRAAEAAFEALVARHGRMVDLTCRLEKGAKYEDIMAALKGASEGSMSGILG